MRLKVVLITYISYWGDPFLMLQILYVAGIGRGASLHSGSCFEMRM